MDTNGTSGYDPRTDPTSRSYVDPSHRAPNEGTPNEGTSGEGTSGTSGNKIKATRIKEICEALYWGPHGAAGRCSRADNRYSEKLKRRASLCSDSNEIPKVSNAGEIVDKEGSSCQVMHNGVLIHEGCYHQSTSTDIIKNLRGHHEPQEEKLFHETLKYVKRGGTMMECGSFWAYYSLWFNKEIPEARNIMIEPDPLRLEIGQLNFELNNFKGEFFNGEIQRERKKRTNAVPIDWLMNHYELDFLNILHADIQKNEMALLEGSENSLRLNKIDFIFIGTHSPNKPITKKLKEFDYNILQEFEIKQSFSEDGLILACSPRVLNKIDTNDFEISKNDTDNYP